MSKAENSKTLALFRYAVISPLINGTSTATSNSKFFIEQSMKDWQLPDGTTYKFGASTIQKWYYIYKKKGFEGLTYKKRSDNGKHRKVTEEVINQINELLEELPRINSKVIYLKLISSGFIKENNPSYSTIHRVVSTLKENKKTNENGKVFLRYEAKHINDIWCADTTMGLRLYTKDNKSKKLVIIGIIDDASRMIIACKIYDSDNNISYLKTLNTAFRRNGIPRVLNVDNGSNYRSQAASIICANLGISLHFDPVHTPQSKAKIERFFRTLKEDWMATINFHSFHSIEEYQKSLDEWINKYNNRVHSSLEGKTPVERYIQESKNVIHKSEEEIEKAFILEENRKATFDSLVTLNGVIYQLPPKYANRKVKMAFAYDKTKAYVKEDEGTLIEVQVLDKVANSQIKRFELGKEED